MALDWVKPDDLYSKYSTAKTFMLPLFEPFDEFERIARNKPHPGIAKNLPKVTDGTLAALIQEQPKRIVQQIPTGKIVSNSDWMNIIGNYILEKEIIPNANQVAALIQKSWAMISKALTYGSQPVFVQFINRGEYFGTDFTLPYVKDVLLEPGKLSDRDSNVIFLRTWWTKSQLESVIKRESTLTKNSKNRKDAEQYESSWDVNKLKQVVTKTGQKDTQSMTPNEREKQLNAEFIEVVHCFQRGIGAKFYSFVPSLGESDNIVRTKVNKDPRGVIPIHYMYTNIDMSNPLGRGAVELSGGMQNLLDSEVQSYQYMRALMLNPPVEKRGNFSKSTIVYEPQAVWDMGNDPNATVRPVQLSTESLTSFPNNYGLIKSQILNLNSSTDTSVSSEVGNPGFSKTPAGVKTQEMRLGVSDNYMRKQFESTFEEIMETAVNLYFAERSGTQVLALDSETAAKLRKVAPEAVNEKNEVQIDFDTETEALKFEVDASTSSAKDDAAERDRLVELLDLSQKYPALAQIMGEDGTRELVNRIVVKTGVEDPEKIMPAPTDEEVGPDGQPVQEQPQGPDPETMQMVQQMIQEAMQQQAANDPKNNPTIQLMDALKIKFTDLPEDAQHQVLEQVGFTSQQPTTTAQELEIKRADVKIKGVDKMQSLEGDMQQEQQDLDENDQMLIEELTKRGYNGPVVDQAVQMMRQGLPNEQIIQALNGGVNE
jgi:hypothetical protein